MPYILTVALLILSLLASQPLFGGETGVTSPDLAALEARAPGENTYPNLSPEFHREIIRLVESNSLRTGEDFFRIARLVCPIESEFRDTRMRHELLVTAVALDCQPAEAWLRMSWDGVQHTLGRPLRFDVYGLAARDPDDGQRLDSAPACVQEVLRDPAAARAAAAQASEHVEIQELVAADQKARQNPGKLSSAEREAMIVADRARNVRICTLVAEGAPRTARDFASAALVLQHSGSFEGFRLAHELALCALVLGDRSRGRWLVAATYDRMLRTVGHDQRFGTQSAPTFSPGAKPQLARVEEAGICDTQRLALGCATLAAKRADFFAKPEK